MIHLFLFECKKILKKKTTLTILLISIITMIAFYFFQYSVAQKIHNGNITKLQNVIAMFQNGVDETKKDPSGEKASDSKDQILRYKQSIEKYKKEKDYYINEDWKKIYNLNIKDLENTIKLNKEGGNSTNPSISIENQQISWFTTRATLEESKLIEKNNIKPFIQNTLYTSYLPTIYDHFTGSSLEEWNKMTKRYSMTGLSFLYQVIQNLYIPVFILVGCFIFGNTLSSESNKKKRGLYFYFIQPIRRRTLLFAKYLSGLMCTMGFVIMLLLIPLLCSLFTKGIGDFRYPVLVYEGAKPNPFGSEFNALNPDQDQFHFIHLIDYLWQAMVLTILLVIFLYSIYFLISLYIKNSIVTISLVGILTYLGMKAPISPYNPFIYMDIHKILNGEMATFAFNTKINFQSGIQLIMMISVIVICIVALLFQQRFKNGIN